MTAISKINYMFTHTKHYMAREFEERCFIYRNFKKHLKQMVEQIN
ncbi:hypothetical protein CHCC20333_3270 [Bacillus paralicheniformis]|nr:hypothetical protein CHCC20333_3270 [Bacillus paralicheniformis]